MTVARSLWIAQNAGIGIQLDASSRNLSGVNSQSTLCILFFVFAIARAWELVGARDTSLLSTVAGMAQQQAGRALHLTESDQAGTASPPDDGDDPGASQLPEPSPADRSVTCRGSTGTARS